MAVELWLDRRPRFWETEAFKASYQTEPYTPGDFIEQPSRGGTAQIATDPFFRVAPVTAADRQMWGDAGRALAEWGIRNGTDLAAAITICHEAAGARVSEWNEVWAKLAFINYYSHNELYDRTRYFRLSPGASLRLGPERPHLFQLIEGYGPEGLQNQRKALNRLNHLMRSELAGELIIADFHLGRLIDRPSTPHRVFPR